MFKNVAENNIVAPPLQRFGNPRCRFLQIDIENVTICAGLFSYRNRPGIKLCAIDDGIRQLTLDGNAKIATRATNVQYNRSIANYVPKFYFHRIAQGRLFATMGKSIYFATIH